jgi:alkylhydroperoxidase family enzyme
MARVPYIEPADLLEEYRNLTESYITQDDLDPELQPLMERTTRNSFLAIGNLPEVLKAFRELIHVMGEEIDLGPEQQEYVILTVARELSSRYEWHNHVRIALHKGVSVDEIHAIAENRLDVFEPADAALMQYVSAFVSGTVNDDVHADLAAHFDEKTIVGIGMYSGYFLMGAHLFDALEIETEEQFVGWNLENVEL